MRTTDRILGTPRGTAGHAIGHATTKGASRLGDVTAYVREVYRLAPSIGIDPAICVAQSCHETGNWTSSWWRERLNPAGIGITGDPVENLQSHTWENGIDAARAHLAHLLVYVLGPADAGSLWFRVTGTPIRAVDVRYDAYLEAYGNTAQAETIKDLSGTWATDRLYAEGIVARGNAIFPDLPDQQEDTPPVAGITFGNVPHPPFEDRNVPTPPNTAWDDLGPRTIRAICWHRSQGTHQGNDQWFRGGGAKTALTDYGIGVLAIDGSALAGSLYRWNDPRGRRSPWANGRVDGAYGDGAKFVARYGVDAVNRDCTSVEISGFYPVPGVESRNTPLDDKSRETLAQLTAYWADQYHVGHDTFPLIPGEGDRSFVIWHQEFTLGTGKECPGPIVMGETDKIIARVKEILRAAQTGSTPTTTTTPAPSPYPPSRVPAPDTMSAQGHPLAVNVPNRFRCTQGGHWKTAPSRDAPDGVKTPYAAGRVYTLDFTSDVDGETWLVSKAGSWAPAQNFKGA